MTDEIPRPVILARETVERLLNAPPARRRRPRKPSLLRALREAKRAGVNVAGATLAADGSVSVTFGEPQAGEKQSNELDEWLAKRAH